MKKRPKVKTRKGFFRRNFGKSIDYIKESKSFIYTIIWIFVVSILLGVILPVPKEISDKIAELVKSLIAQTDGMSARQVISFIFSNNVQSSFFGMIFGIFFGIFSVFTTFFNGYLLGFVALKATQSEGILVLWKLVPHGIFELPALLISLGLGLRLGSFIFQKKKIDSLKYSLVNSLRTFLFVIIPLLLIAAIIEGSLIALFG